MNHVNNATNIKKLSRTGIRYMLKKIMGYSYKRASSIDNRVLAPERIRLFAEIFYIQDFLEEQGYNLIWIDEFHTDLSKVNGYNWSNKGLKLFFQKFHKLIAWILQLPLIKKIVVNLKNQRRLKILIHLLVLWINSNNHFYSWGENMKTTI